MLRANVYFTIANKNFTEEMANKSSLDFDSISKPLCEEVRNSEDVVHLLPYLVVIRFHYVCHKTVVHSIA